MDYRRVFEKIKENAEDGLTGSKSYKDDRLLMIAGMAASAMLTMDQEVAEASLENRARTFRRG